MRRKELGQPYCIVSRPTRAARPRRTSAWVPESGESPGILYNSGAAKKEMRIFRNYLDITFPGYRHPVCFFVLSSSSSPRFLLSLPIASLSQFYPLTSASHLSVRVADVPNCLLRITVKHPCFPNTASRRRGVGRCLASRFNRVCATWPTHSLNRGNFQCQHAWPSNSQLHSPYSSPLCLELHLVIVDIGE
jgi:hypothetical protein